MTRNYPVLILPKLILPILLLLLIPVFAGMAAPEKPTEKDDRPALSAMADSDTTTLLIAGYDDNRYADSILLVRADNLSHTLRTVLIRGECYVRDPICPDGRLGSAFAEGYRRAKKSGADEESARKAGMHTLADILNKTLSVKVDGCAALGYDAFRDIVDRADGVDIKLPRKFVCSDGLTLKKGENHLDGATAERFLRFGQSDDKINPRRLFFSTLLKKIKREFPIMRAISLGIYTYRRADTDLGLTRSLSLVRAAMSAGRSGAKIAELSGAPIELNGETLLIVNRNWARDLVNDYLGAGLADDDFDPGERLTDPGNAEIEEIYRGRAPGMNGWGDAYNVPSIQSSEVIS